MGNWVRAKDELEWDGYGDDWDELRRRVLRRDRFRCQRCGSCDRTLQAHHSVPRSQGGPDTLSNLITLCTPCHAVQHPSNLEFAEELALAQPFPAVGADERVATLHPDYRQCARCETTGTSESLVGVPASFLRYSTTPVALCKPCAGVVCGAHRTLTVPSLRSTELLSGRDILGRIPEAPMLPSASNPPAAVAVPRGPVTRIERLVVRYRGLFRRSVRVLVATIFVVCTVFSTVVNTALLRAIAQGLSVSPNVVVWMAVLLAASGTVGSLVATALVWALTSRVGGTLWKRLPQHVPTGGLSPATSFGGVFRSLCRDQTLVVVGGLVLQLGVSLAVV